METKNILVIENQRHQYIQIVKNFKQIQTQEFQIEVFPKEGQYEKYIDNVRVWVTEIYGEQYRRIALDNIEETILSNQIDLILMDHILGGSIACKTGIDLAREINGQRVQKSCPLIPVVFLSKSEHTLENRLKEYDKYNGDFSGLCYWVHKGYFGDEVLKLSYFRQYVLNAVNTQLGASNAKRFWDTFSIVESLNLPEEFKKHLARIKKTIGYEKLSEPFMEMISAVSKSKNYFELDEKILANERQTN